MSKKELWVLPLRVGQLLRGAVFAPLALGHLARIPTRLCQELY